MMIDDLTISLLIAARVIFVSQTMIVILHVL